MNHKIKKMKQSIDRINQECNQRGLLSKEEQNRIEMQEDIENNIIDP